MVKEYLEKYQNWILDEKIDCENEYKRLEQRLKEDIEFRCLLEEKNDPNFEAFTPHEINAKNKEKIKELELDEEQLRKRQEVLIQKISELENRLEELKKVILVASENEQAQQVLHDKIQKSKEERLKLLEMEEENRRHMSDYLNNFFLQNLSALTHKIELCSGLIELEPVRCKMELASLSKIAENIVHDLNHEKEKLHPIYADAFDFIDSVKEELKKLSISSEIEIHFNSEGDVSNIKSIIGVTLLRIILELCNNSVEQQADTISVKLISDTEAISIQIIENGKRQNMEQECSGVRNLVYLLSGNLSINSEMEENIIQIDVPLI